MMFSAEKFTKSLFTSSNADFEDLALQLFKYQVKNNDLYQTYVQSLGFRAEEVLAVKDIPFLPIGFFKTHEIKTGIFEPELVFESSGTTQTVPSSHFVKDVRLYEQSFRKAFELFYGKITDYVIIGLLPSYLERQHSSLVYMVNDLIQLSGYSESGFYLDEHKKLADQLKKLEDQGQKTLLIGVTFGLLDFAEKYPLSLRETIVMETGGMKGRREEWTREQVHGFLKEKFGIKNIHSEYGMTELLSQAYSQQDGLFHCPPWMKIALRDMRDPLQLLPWPEPGQSSQGLINVIDLANIHSCAFMATDDVGKLYSDGSFEVLGRQDNSDLRGCSMMVG